MKVELQPAIPFCHKNQPQALRSPKLPIPR